MAEETPIHVSIVIRPPDPHEGELLREIAFRSKAHWGYEAATVREWVDRGDFSPRRLRELTVFVAYERMGASYLRDSEPNSWGRTIPTMGIDLDA